MIAMTPRARAPCYCVNEHEHRDRALADAVAAGRFTLRRRDARRSASSPTGCDADLPDDEEWRIDWVKFYYGLDLADAFRATGDARYLRRVGAARRELRRSRSRPTTTPARSPRAGS